MKRWAKSQREGWRAGKKEDRMDTKERGGMTFADT